MSKRPYEKKNSEYWNKISQPKSQSQEISTASTFTPESFGEPFVTFGSEQAFGSTRQTDASSSRTSRINRSTITPVVDRFSQLRQLTLPFKYKNGSVDIKDAVELCQKVYANVACFRNAIDLMSDFANTDIYLEGGTKGSRDFFNRWQKRIGMTHLKDQTFREYFRSSNIFLYRIDAKINIDDFLKISTIYAKEGDLSSTEIPVRYILLNPSCMVSKGVSSFDGSLYEKILSPSELNRLKDPKTEEDKELFNGLSEDVKTQIKNGAWTLDGISMKLDPKKVHVFHAKRSDYEPFAIPFGYPVLDDINLKLEMKRYDQAILRTVESVILLVTMGAKPDEGGINQANIKAMQNLLTNGTTGRTIVADWTTDAKFVVPELNKILGPEKYEIVNQDIREGLQNVIVGEEKYGNTQTKVQVFLDKLNEARSAFLEYFLNPEIKRIAKEMGFRSYPTAKFTNTSIKDNTEMMRVAVRMAELGLLTPEQVLETIHRGQFTNPEDVRPSQEGYIKDRKDGLYMPLSPVPIVTAAPAPIDPNAQFKAASTPSKAKPKVGGVKGRPTGGKASLDSIKDTIFAAQKLNSFVSSEIMKAHNVEELNDTQKKISQELAEKIICAAKKEDWESIATSCVKDPNGLLNLGLLPEIEELSVEAGLKDYDAAIYVHSLME